MFGRKFLLLKKKIYSLEHEDCNQSLFGSEKNVSESKFVSQDNSK
jgi:hypothetical protein